jgi:hypothetical protein
VQSKNLTDKFNNIEKTVSINRVRQIAEEHDIKKGINNEDVIRTQYDETGYLEYQFSRSFYIAFDEKNRRLVVRQVGDREKRLVKLCRLVMDIEYGVLNGITSAEKVEFLSNKQYSSTVYQ